MQAKLLRVLQERTFERVGGSQTISADVRWVAATNRDLVQMMDSGDFREDLFHRIAVFPVRLPPLRERRDDLCPLAEALLDQVAAEVGRPGMSLSPAAVKVLEGRRWRGNIRELRNVLERAVILADTSEIGPDLVEGDAASGARAQTSSALVTMEDAERSAIEAALRHTNGNRRLAAERLGIGTRTLYDKLKRYGLG